MLISAPAIAQSERKCAATAQLSDGWTLVDGEWMPGNQKRHVGKPPVPVQPEELPPFLDQAYGIRREGYIFGPKGGTLGPHNTNFDAVFNPTAWREDETIYILVRGEKNKNDGNWKRQSIPYLATYRPGYDPKMSSKPMLEATEDYEKPGGLEDFRFVDLSLKPAKWVDPKTGQIKTYRRMLTYVAFGGTPQSPRVCGVLFNSARDFETGNYKKLGPMFKDKDVIANRGGPWNKSAAMVQYRDSQGQVRQVVYVNEGSEKEGGTHAIEVTGEPYEWSYPKKGVEPVIKSRPGLYDQNLVEPAFQPIVAPLPDALRHQLKAEKGIRQTHGIYVAIHGDSPGIGYQLGYRIFSLDDPTGPPIYESKGTFFRPQDPREIDQGQVHGVVFMPAFVTMPDGTVHLFWGAGDKWVGHATAKMAPTSQALRNRRGN